MNWNYLVGPICILIGTLVTLYVKDKAREVAKQEFADQMQSTFSTFKLDLIKTLDETYCRKGECKLMMEAHDDRIDVNDERINDIEGAIYRPLNKGAD